MHHIPRRDGSETRSIPFFLQSGIDHKEPVLHIGGIWIVMHLGKYYEFDNPMKNESGMFTLTSISFPGALFPEFILISYGKRGHVALASRAPLIIAQIVIKKM